MMMLLINPRVHMVDEAKKWWFFLSISLSC
jgi:hypothetical protein